MKVKAPLSNSETAEIRPFQKPQYRQDFEKKVNERVARRRLARKYYTCDVLHSANEVRRSVFVALTDVAEWLDEKCLNNPHVAVFIDADIIYCHPTLQEIAEKTKELLKITI